MVSYFWSWFTTMISSSAPLAQSLRVPCIPTLGIMSRQTNDYILMDAVHAFQVISCCTHECHPLNSSDHLPLSISVSLSPISSKPSTHAPPKLNWRAGDQSVAVYSEAVGDIIRPNLGKTYDSVDDLNTEILKVTKAILLAASSTIPTKKRKKPTKLFSKDPELKRISSQCKAAWRKWKSARSPTEGEKLEEKKRLKRQCANKCRANLERKFWEKREMLFKTKNPKRFKTPSNNISLGDRLLHNGKITCDPFNLAGLTTFNLSSAQKNPAQIRMSCQLSMTYLAS